MNRPNWTARLCLAGVSMVMLCGMAVFERVDFYYIGGEAYPIAYSYTLHEPPEGGQGILQDQCTGGPFVSSPQLPTGGYDEYPIYVCAPGPYLPPDWPY